MEITSLEQLGKIFLEKADRFVDVHRKVKVAKKYLEILPDKSFIVDKDGRKIMKIGIGINKELPMSFEIKDGALNESRWVLIYDTCDVNYQGEEIDHGEEYIEDRSNPINKRSFCCKYLTWCTKTDLSTVVTKDILNVLWYSLEQEFEHIFNEYLKDVNDGKIQPPQHPTYSETFAEFKAQQEAKKKAK